MPVYFHTEIPNFKFKNEKATGRWLKDVCINEKRISGTINIIALSDTALFDMNKSYLGHEYFTDVLSFPGDEKKKISGDIFISIERIEENANHYNVSPEEELHRVMLHGLLHLLGYEDHDETTQIQMREKEEYYLSKYHLSP